MSDLTIDGGRGLMVDEGRIGAWMQTWTGRRFYPSDPRPEDVSIIDIVHALGNMSRYGGHCAFYSVAEHSDLVSQILPDQHKFEGLTHDFAEAYITDMIRPIKRCIGPDNEYFKLEQNIWEKAIAPAFGLPVTLPHEVIVADLRMCLLEKESLHPRSQDWDIPYPCPTGVKIDGVLPPFTYFNLLYRYCKLSGTAYNPLCQELQHYLEEDRIALEAAHKKGLQ